MGYLAPLGPDRHASNARITVCSSCRISPNYTRLGSVFLSNRLPGGETGYHSVLIEFRRRVIVVVRFQNDHFVWVEVHENRDSSEGGLNSVEGLLSTGGPCKSEVLADELREGVGDERISLNHPAAEFGKTKKDLYIFDTARDVPFLYCFYIYRVHVDAFVGDNQAQICSCLGVKFTFFWIEEDPNGSERDEHFADMYDVFGNCVTVHVDVFKIGGAE